MVGRKGVWKEGKAYGGKEGSVEGRKEGREYRRKEGSMEDRKGEWKEGRMGGMEERRNKGSTGYLASGLFSSSGVQTSTKSEILSFRVLILILPQVKKKLA